MSKSGQTALAAAIIIAGPVWADVTPDEVWLSWQNLAQSQGQKLTADSAETDGDTLTVKGLTLTLGADGSATMDQIELTDNGDGTVAITLPDSFGIHLIPPKDNTSQADIDLTIAAPDADITASGVPDSIGYDHNLPTLDITAKGQNQADQMDATLKMTEVTGKYLAEAAEVGQNLTGAFSTKTFALAVAAKGDGSDATITLSLSDLGGKAEITGLPADDKVELDTALQSGMTFDAALTYGIGALDISGTNAGAPMKMAGTLGGGAVNLSFDAGKFHYDATNKALSLNVAGTDQASGGAYTFAGAMADFNTALDMNGSNWSKADDFSAALKAGLLMAGSVGLGATNIDFAGGPGDKPVKVKLALGGAKTEFTLASTQMTYDFGTKAVSATLASPDIPVPEVSVDVAELAFGLSMPMTKSDQPAPFTYLTRIVDLKLPEALWAMVDPAGSLPHDAATVIVDTKGTATLTKDLATDTTGLENAEAPGMLNSLDVTQILARAAGAEITAKGAFTFDNTDTVTMPGMPLPTGKIDIKATGMNALIDKLVAMGLLLQDQAMQGKMMMSMFALNDMAKDEITSLLEFRDKHIFANGAQLQ